MFTRPVSACIGLVCDPNSEKFAQTGEIISHDWKEYGDVSLRFVDDLGLCYNDGLMADDPMIPGVMIFEKSGAEKLLQAQLHLPKIRERLVALKEIAERVSLPKSVRLAAKHSFWTTLRGEE